MSDHGPYSDWASAGSRAEAESHLISLLALSPPKRHFCAQKTHQKRAFLRLFCSKTALNVPYLHCLSRVCRCMYAQANVSISPARVRISPHPR